MVLGRKTAQQAPKQEEAADEGPAQVATAGAARPNAVSDVGTASLTAGGNDLLYAKAMFEGFAGEKEVIFVPETIKWTPKLVDQMLEAMDMERPNLVLSIYATYCPAVNMLDEDEIQCPAIQQLCEEGASVGDRNAVIKDVLSLKMKDLTGAVMSSLEQTNSIPYLENGYSSFALDLSSLKSSTGIKAKLVVASSLCNRDLIKGGKVQKSFTEELLPRAVPLNETSVEAAQPHMLDFKWLQEAMQQDFNHIHHWTCDDMGNQLPDDKKHAGGQTWGDGDIYFVGYRPNPSGGADLDTGSQTIQMSASVLAPNGMFFIGGRNPQMCNDVIQSFECGVPTVLVKHSGGITGIWAEVVLAIVQIIKNEPGWRAQYAKSDEPSADQSISGRISAVSALKLLDYAITATCIKRENCGVKLAQISHTLDIAKSRHQLFLETVRIVDPLKHTPEQALEILSSCFSSTYVGLQELGATTAQRDVIAKAWEIHQGLEFQAGRLRRWELALAYLGAGLAWLAIVAATSLDVGHSCGDDSVAGFRFCSILGRKSMQKVLEFLTIVVPAGSALIVTIAARMQYRVKWGTVQLAAAQIVRHIYLFRGGVDMYDIAKQGDDDEGISQSAAAKMARMKFVKNIASMHSKVLSFDSMDMDRTSTLSSAEISAHIAQYLYGQDPSSRKSKEAGGGLEQIPRDGGARRLSSVRPETEKLLEEGSKDSKIDDDDGISATTAETYHKHRLRQLLCLYQDTMPSLTRKSDQLRLVIFLFGFLASMLGATKNSSWIPSVVGFSTMLEVLMVCHNMVTRSGAMMAAISTLVSIDMQWNGLSNMDRRTPKFKAFLMFQTEQQALAVVEAWVGQMSTADAADSGGGHGATQGKDSKSKPSGKEKKSK